MELSTVIPAFLIGLVTTFVTSLVLVLTKKYHGKLSLDGDVGVQKMHDTPTPRIGGVAIAVGFIVAGFLLPNDIQSLWLIIGLAGSLAFGFGLAEDITNKVRVKWRLLATMGSGLIFAILSGYAIHSIDIGWFDLALATTVGSLAFTAFAVGGAANAINLVDGFHGLSSGTLVIILASIALVGWRVEDPMIMIMAITMAGIVLGFLLINFPFGFLFLGDAGAYFAGYVVAALVVMLPARHPDVSPWVSLLIVGYPVTETIVSIFRRWFSDASAGDPDSDHLHHIVHRGPARKVAGALGAARFQNALTGMFMWVMPIVTFGFVAMTSMTTLNAISYLLGTIAIYVVLYYSLRSRVG